MRRSFDHLTDEEMARAMHQRDESYDGLFFTCVTSTGIFCLVSCPARKPRRENIRFARSREEAAAWGFRPMMNQRERAAYFRQMHANGPLVLPNAWDAASAGVIERAGALAIATTSAGIAWANGYADGQKLQRDEMIRVIRQAGAVGIDLEDSPGRHTEPLLAPEVHAGRIRAAREAARRPCDYAGRTCGDAAGGP